MMKFLSLLVLLFACGICNAQNLVPNGDFETFSDCPTSVAQIDKATNWFTTGNYNKGGGSPDYFNRCSTSDYCGVPYNNFGYQNPHSGNAYAGMGLYLLNANFREYIETSLTTALTRNVTYHLEFYFNLGNYSKYSTSTFGVYFSKTIIAGIDNPRPLLFSPQLTNSPGTVPDTSSWIKFSGDFTAEGGEKYIVIGNFKADSNTAIVNYNLNAKQNVTYLYIDDVKLEASSSLQVYPGPTEGDRMIKCPEGIVKVEFYNSDSVLVKTIKNPSAASTFISCNDLAKGSYKVRLSKSNSFYFTLLFIDE